MFYNYSELLNNSDLFNVQRKRNIKNTCKALYNCAGYALGTFSWYCPNEEDDDDYWGLDDLSDAEMAYKTFETVEFMLKDFKGRLRLIGSVDEVQENEYAIAYRISSDGDFHFMKKMRNDWYHKRGNTDRIYVESEDYVLKEVWCGRYDGPIVLMAMRREQSLPLNLDVIRLKGKLTFYGMSDILWVRKEGKTKWTLNYLLLLSS